MNMLNQILRKMLRKLGLSVNHRRIAGTQNNIQRRLTCRPGLGSTRRIQRMCKVLGTGCFMGSSSFPGIGSREERLHTGDRITNGSTKNKAMLRLRSRQECVRLLLQLLHALRRQTLSTQRLHLLHHTRRHRTVQVRGAG